MEEGSRIELGRLNQGGSFEVNVRVEYYLIFYITMYCLGTTFGVESCTHCMMSCRRVYYCQGC